MKGDQNHDAIFLVMNAGSNVNIEKFRKRDGKIRYIVDQLKNPESISITVGGEYGNATLIAGQIGTASDDPDSLALFDAFRRQVRKRFTKVNAYYVGPNAMKALEAGARLTPSIRAAEACDLKKE